MASDAYHWAFGRHSGILDCCIKFWLTEWEIDGQLDEVYAKKMIDSGPSWGYVPCPSCLTKRNKIMIIDCDIDCGGVDECVRYFEALTKEHSGAILDQEDKTK